MHLRRVALSTEKNPFETLSKAHEDSYHLNHDEVLIEKFRAQLAKRKATEGLQAKTGLTDASILARLSDLGITADTLPILHLLPLLDVAWADGEIQETEKNLLLEAAHLTGVTSGPALKLFEGFLNQPPEQELVAAATDFISLLLCVLTEQEQQVIKTNLVDFAWRIADACGGVFGLWGRVEDSEKRALTRIAESLAVQHPDASNALLKRL